ncbi:tyrosine-type recombinase/integrase [Falsihalocynthiibacter arcticus]|nr:tyrosine-type recombinase/integrase [Falsihalocynthiibacter arcticus]
MAKYLQKRRRRWYAVLEIPKDVRQKFGGSPRFVQSLETESLSVAETRVLRVVADWKDLISAARGDGGFVESDYVAKALVWRDGICNAQHSENEKFTIQSIIDDDLQAIALKKNPTAMVMSKIAYGETYPLDRDIEAWLASQEVQEKTRDMKRSDATRFATRFKFTDQVNRQSLLNWAHDLQIRDQLKPPTVRRIISHTRGYWDYLHILGHIHDRETVFDRVGPKKLTKSKSAKSERRQAFSSSDLPKLLLGALDKKDCQLAQLIWLGIWTGCRIEELCSLKVSDVEVEFFIVKDAKTQAGLRSVPIHPRLAPMIRHLCSNSSDGYLISGLSFNKYDDRSNAIGKRFGRLKSALGFDQRLVFHSLRKTFTTELENAGVPENVTADIVGHEKKTLTYGLYSKGNRIEVLQKAIRKITLEIDPSIDLLLVS